MPSIRIGGTAVVCCIHGREKRAITEAEFNPQTASPALCPCCENVFLTNGDAVVCAYCDPRRSD